MSNVVKRDPWDEPVPVWEYRELIEDKIKAHPRSLQKRIGPSELGTACDRKLALKLSGAPQGERDAAWRPTVGTAVHAWLEECFGSVNQVMENGQPRFRVEQRVTVGTIDGDDIDGSCDLYDELFGNVLDWKCVGPTSLKGKKKYGPGETYRIQAHLYGRGFQLLGLPVNNVVIAFLPSAGELSDAVWWTEPYNETIAIEAMQRADALAAGGRVLGWPSIIEQTSKFDDMCDWCPFNTGQDSATTCSGFSVREPVKAKQHTAQSWLS